MITKITHITMLVNNLDESLAFYQKIGFKIHTDAAYGEIRWLTICTPNQPDVELVLLQAQTAEEKALVGKQTGNHPFLSLESNDVMNDFAKLKQSDVAILEEPADQPWGICGMIQDPNGTKIYICQPK
jgi:predicted enzyme related to lactoylglutathione lyase